jgi:TRAP-type mannitol/chloroaromatic compound transport system permease small subunit
MEHSSNSGGLARYPIKFVVPFGFFMLSLQGLSEIIKRIGALNGKVTLPAEDLRYEKPMQ